MPKHHSCCRCKRRCKSNPRHRRPIPTSLESAMERELGRPMEDVDVICSACRRRLYRSSPIVAKHQQSCVDISDPDYHPSSSSSSETVFKSPKSIQLKVKSTPRNHKNCVICRKQSGHRNHLTVIPSSAITQAFIHTAIFINSDSRCCKFHLDNGFFTSDTLTSLSSSKDFECFSRSQISNLLDNIRNLMKSTSHLNFEIPSALRDEDYVNLTGLSRDQFSELSSYITTMRNTSTRSTRTCLAVFLTKLRTGLPNSILSSIFSLTTSQVQRIIPSVREALMESFVPHHIGFQHMTHQEFCQKHITPIAKTLFTTSSNNNEAVLVLDGTYIYIQKSSDYDLQRKCYSLHKNRPLIKPMMVVGTDGYILSVLGPYMADYHNNDANIVKHMMKLNSEGIKDWLQADDVLVVDRGFRDSVSLLEENGFKVEMPIYLPKGCKQHTTEEANISRLVTKVRWVVESANGRIKQWKLLDKVVPNTLIPHIGDFIKIICAICNRFRPSLASMDPNSKQIAEKMLEKVKLPNLVKELVLEQNLLSKKSLFTSIDAADAILADFPRIDMDSLRDITMGVYQLKQSVHYSREHLKDDGSYELMVSKEVSGLLRVQIRSRHSRNIKHTLWIQYDVHGNDSVSGWYCTCKVGSRVVGCCAHVASVLWYLGYQRWQEQPIITTSGPGTSLINATAFLEE